MPSHPSSVQRRRLTGHTAPLLIAATMTAGSGAAAHLQAQDAQAAQESAAALLAQRSAAAAVTTSRAAHRAALAHPLASSSRYADIDPARTPSLPDSLTRVASTDTRATAKLRLRLAEAIDEMQLTGRAYAQAAARASSTTRAVFSSQGAVLAYRSATARTAPSDADLLAARTAELEAADMHRAAIATTMTLRAQVLASAQADYQAVRARQDAAIKAGTAARAADGTMIAMPALGTPIRGNGWTMTAPVRSWIAQALTTLYAHGYPRSSDDAMNLATIIYNESGGDPGSRNDYDRNAAMGMPSFGLMQTVGPTFETCALPGFTQTGDPIHQIMAGARYAQMTYGSLAKVPGVRSLAAGGRYLPY